MRNNSCSNVCRELVVYRLKPERQQQLIRIREHMSEQMATIPGFIKIESWQACEDEDLCTDVVWWQNKSAAMNGYQQWKQLPSASAFMECVAEVIFSNHFQAGSQVQGQS